MIVVLRNGVSRKDVAEFTAELEARGFGVHISEGHDATIVGLLGDTSRLDTESFLARPIVESAMRVKAPYKMAGRSFHPENSVYDVDGSKIGDGNVAVMAGPCSVENEEQVAEIAMAVKASGARFLRGGAFKPRTSPYSFQGLGRHGIELLLAAKRATGLPVVTELMSFSTIDMFEDVDIIQIGARNMQNFDLLKELGGIRKPVLLKRGLSATVKELLMSAEYIMASGNEQVILCERGIRTFDSYTRNCLDLSIVPYLKRETHLPVIIDPSHACGMSWMVPVLANAAVAAGADGLIIEVHNNPAMALCDGEQSLTPAQFDGTMRLLRKYAAVEGRGL